MSKPSKATPRDLRAGSPNSLEATEPSRPSPAPHVSVFDGLRGLAILLVVASHASGISTLGRLTSVLAQGMYGVQIFFVVSAATLMLASVRRKELDLAAFAIRRAARIVPLYYVGILLYLVLPTAPGIYGEARRPLGLLVNALFLHGFVPTYQNNVVPGGWSIGCEMAFYALFPFLFRTVTTVRRAVALIGVGWIVDLALSAYGRSQGWGIVPTMALYFHPLFELPVFATGIAVFRITHGKGPAEGPARLRFQALAAVGFLGVFALGVWGHLRPWALLPISLCVGALVAGCLMAPPRVLTHPAMVRLGLISFSFYIWHFVVLFGILSPLTFGMHRPLPVLATFSLGLLLTWPLAELSRRWIELPGIEVGRRAIDAVRRRRSATA